MNTLLKPFYAVVPLSLEELFAEELKKLGIEKFRLEKGGCWFGAEMSQMMQVNLWTRYASRILLKVTEGPYRTEEDIYKLAKSFRWEQYFTPENTFKIELSSRRSPLKSVAFAALRVKDAVCDYFRETDGQRPDVEKHDPDIRIYVHLTDKNCIIYLDTSGESLFKRGWREAKGEASERKPRRRPSRTCRLDTGYTAAGSFLRLWHHHHRSSYNCLQYGSRT